MRFLARLCLRLLGWRFEGEDPRVPRYVAVGAPHTSNWDFLVFLAVVSHFHMPARVLAKHTLFRWPFGPLMRRLGGIPVRRGSGEQTVARVVEAFRESERMALVVAPEGTRGCAPAWHSGFYRIAQAADVPIVLGYVDFRRKRAGLGPVIRASGDVRADMDLIRAFYADKVGRHPEGMGPMVLPEEEGEPDPTRG